VVKCEVVILFISWEGIRVARIIIFLETYFIFFKKSTPKLMSASSPIRIPSPVHCPPVNRSLKRTYSTALGRLSPRSLEQSQFLESETESSDGSDDGSSLEDFVVADSDDDSESVVSSSSDGSSDSDEVAVCSVCDEEICVCSDETQFGLDRAVGYSQSPSFLVSLSEHTDVVSCNIVSNENYHGFDENFHFVEAMSDDVCIDRSRSDGFCKHMVASTCDSCKLKNLRDLYYAKVRLGREDMSEGALVSLANDELRLALNVREFQNAGLV